jgi:hypothetical protein
MSCRPNAFGAKEPTGAGERRSQRLPQPSHTVLPVPISSPQWRAVVVPARAAYSHSASDGSRYRCPVTCESQALYSSASTRDTSFTGWSSVMPRRRRGWCVHAPALTHWPHSRNVTSYLPMANDAPISTSTCGFSARSVQSGRTGFDSEGSSPSGLPIMNRPGGSTTMTGP